MAGPTGFLMLRAVGGRSSGPAGGQHGGGGWGRVHLCKDAAVRLGGWERCPIPVVVAALALLLDHVRLGLLLGLPDLLAVRTQLVAAAPDGELGHQLLHNTWGPHAALPRCYQSQRYGWPSARPQPRCTPDCCVCCGCVPTAARPVVLRRRMGGAREDPSAEKRGPEAVAHRPSACIHRPSHGGPRFTTRSPQRGVRVSRAW